MAYADDDTESISSVLGRIIIKSVSKLSLNKSLHKPVSIPIWESVSTLYRSKNPVITLQRFCLSLKGGSRKFSDIREIIKGLTHMPRPSFRSTKRIRQHSPIHTFYVFCRNY